MKYELIQAGERTYYIDCPSRMGIFVDKNNENEVYMIDSSNDENAARKARQILDKNNWQLKAIFNTHAHADHVGGNNFLQKRTGCKIYAKGSESAQIRHNFFEPAFLYGGNPPEELKTKFLMCKESDAEYLTPEVLPDGLEMIDLPGHSHEMVGFRTEDDVVFLADALASPQAIEKYKLMFLYDPENYVKTLESIKTMDAKLFVPSHAEVTDDIVPAAQYNIDETLKFADFLLDICKTPLCFDDMMEKVFDEYQIAMDFEQYYLRGCSMHSYLSWLKRQEKIHAEFKNNRMYWRV